MLARGGTPLQLRGPWRDARRRRGAGAVVSLFPKSETTLFHFFQRNETTLFHEFVDALSVSGIPGGLSLIIGGGGFGNQCAIPRLFDSLAPLLGQRPYHDACVRCAQSLRIDMKVKSLINYLSSTMSIAMDNGRSSATPPPSKAPASVTPAPTNRGLIGKRMTSQGDWDGYGLPPRSGTTNYHYLARNTSAAPPRLQSARASSAVGCERNLRRRRSPCRLKFKQ